MITMRFCAPSPTSRRHWGRLFVAVGLGVMGLASCGVDQSGLGSMPFLPHDASSGDTAGAAGAGGHPGTAGQGGGGGSGGSVVTGAAGDGASGSGGAAGNGASGSSGAAGDAAGVGGS